LPCVATLLYELKQRAGARIGLLQAGWLDSPFSLTEARV
jgi:hypothetical protein